MKSPHFRIIFSKNLTVFVQNNNKIDKLIKYKFAIKKRNLVAHLFMEMFNHVLTFFFVCFSEFLVIALLGYRHHIM